MRSRLPLTAGLSALLLTPWLATQGAASAPRELTGYLPEDTALVVDVYDGAGCTRELLALMRPLPAELPAMVRLAAQALPLMTRGATGLALEDLLDVLAPGQALFAVWPDGGHGFPVFLSRVEEIGTVRRMVDRTKGKVVASLNDGLLTITDTDRHLREILRFRRSGKPTLLANPDYTSERLALAPGSSVRLYLDLEAVRRIQRGSSSWDRLDAGGRFFIGPWARTLDLGSRLDLRADIRGSGTGRGVRMTGRVDGSPLDPQDEIRAGELLPHGRAERHLQPFPAGTVACVSLDRDLEQFMRNADHYLDEDGVLSVQNAKTTLDTLLAGFSLLEDLLPSLDLPINLFITETADADLDQLPRVTLPAFTLVVPISVDLEKVQRALQRTLNTVALFSNNDRRRDKKPPVQVRSGVESGERFYYLSFGDWPGTGAPPIEHALTPTLLFTEGHGIFASTSDGARRMARALSSDADAGRRVTGDYIALDGPGLARLLRNNQSVLVMDRVMKEGETMRQAELFWTALIAIAEHLTLEASIEPGESDTRLEIAFSRVDNAGEEGPR